MTPETDVGPDGAARGAVAPGQRPPAPETTRLYATDWQSFVAWCAAAERVALPAAGADVAAFLTAAATHCGAGALGRRAAAIAAHHRQAGFAAPTADPAVRAILRATRRAATPRRRPLPRPAQLLRMAAACPGDFSGIRDRALLLLAAAGLGRAALVGLDADHVRFTAASVELTVPQPGGDGASGRTVAVSRGATLASCPVQALQDWLRTSDTRFGPVFRKIDRWGTIEHRRLGTDALRRILARRGGKNRRRRDRTAAT